MAAAVGAVHTVALLVLLASLQSCQGGLHGVSPQSAQVRGGDVRVDRPGAARAGSPLASRPLNWGPLRTKSSSACPPCRRSRAMAAACS